MLIAPRCAANRGALRHRGPEAAEGFLPRRSRCAPATRRNRAVSPDHLGEGQKIDYGADRELARRLVEDDQTVRSHDRGKDPRTVPGIFDSDDGIAVALQTRPQILSPSRLLAIAETGLDRKGSRLADRRASKLRISGRARTRNVTITATGFPGSPINGTPPTWPSAIGRPGLIARRQKWRVPRRSTADLT